jgi:hypothetical protein
MQNFAYIYMLRVDVCAVCDRMHTLGLVDEGELAETSRFVRARSGRAACWDYLHICLGGIMGQGSGGLARAGRSGSSQIGC